MEKNNIEIEPNDIRVFTYSTSGGRWLPSYENGVHLIHLPTGIEIKEHSERSPHRNRVIAMERLLEKLNE